MERDHRVILRIAFLILLLAAVPYLGELANRLLLPAIPQPVAEAPLSSGDEYRLVEVLPAPGDLPKSFTANLGACYHLTYEDPFDLGMDPESLKRVILASRSRCVLLVISAGTAGDPRKVMGLVQAAREAGVDLLVLRIMLRPRWADVQGAAEELARLPWANQDSSVTEAAARVYGDWIRAWASTPMDPTGILPIYYPAPLPGVLNLAKRLALEGVYVQLLNEPNVMEEYSDAPPGAFNEMGLYTGDLRELGRDVCAFHAPFIRAAFDPMVEAPWGQVSYHLNVIQPRLVIPDIAAAGPDQKREYIAGCLEILSAAVGDFPGVDVPEYAHTGLRGGAFAYGMHIYAPNCADPLAAATALRDVHLASVVEYLQAAARGGFPLITRVMVTEFGGAFAFGSACTRERQKVIYSAITAMAPEVPFFWWVFASRRCGYGEYAGNAPVEWDKSAIVSFDPASKTIRACESGEEGLSP
jgi:hypothetical protein